MILNVCTNNDEESFNLSSKEEVIKSIEHFFKELIKNLKENFPDKEKNIVSSLTIEIHNTDKEVSKEERVAQLFLQVLKSASKREEIAFKDNPKKAFEKMENDVKLRQNMLSFARTLERL